MEIKDRILNAARELFMQYGCKSVTMDDIARHLSVSKKTIYQFYQDKEEIVNTFAQTQFDCEMDCVRAIMEAAENPIDEVMRISQHMRENFSKMNPALLFDLQKYHFQAWQMYADYKQSFVSDHIRRNLQQGIQEGLYRPDINVEVLTRLRLELIHLAFNAHVFPPAQFSLLTIQMQSMELFMRGIVTEKGLALLNQYKTQYNTIPSL